MRVFRGLLVALFGCVAWSACQDDNEERFVSKDGSVVVSDGKILKPEWLVEAVDSVGNSYSPSPYSDERYYPEVYLLRYQGEEYICIRDMLSSCSWCGMYLLTISGEPIGGGPTGDTRDNERYNKILYNAESTELIYSSF